jgi:hypothetical protein
MSWAWLTLCSYDDDGLLSILPEWKRGPMVATGTGDDSLDSAEREIPDGLEMELLY